MGKPSVILIELNELSPPLMDRFIAAGELPNFARMRRESEVFVTDAEEKPPYLEPWIQWVTVHTGLSYAEHKVFHLEDGFKLEAPRLWDTLSAHGLSSWICGSMNTGYRPGLRGMIMPDPWAVELEPSNPELSAYLDFVRSNVVEYTNDKIPLGPMDYAKFGLFMLQHGLSPESLIGLGLQLAEERRTGKSRWKRAASLDLLQFDIFKHYWKKTRPDFATFFSNSTAHFQHYYWRNLDPDRFTLKPSADDQSDHHDAVLYGYRRMDSLVGRMIELAGPDTTLVFVTALSQQPYLLYEEDGGKVSYRPRDFDTFLKAVGVTTYSEVVPVMTQNFHIRFPDQKSCSEAGAQLAKLTVSGEQMMAVNPDPSSGDTMQVGCRLHKSIAKEATIDESGLAAPKFFDLLYQIEGVKSGMHHPDGMLWVRRPDLRHVEHEDRLPLTKVAPMILEMFGLDAAKTEAA